MGDTSHRPEEDHIGEDAASRHDGRGSSFSRRTFAIGAGSTAALFGLGSLRYLGTTPLVRPPGGQDQDALLSKCVHCYRCAGACPYELIRSSKIEHGLLSMRTPRMEFSDNYPGVLEALRYCDFCLRENDGVPLCVEACPTQALALPDDFDPQSARIGTAELDTNLCLAYRSGYCSFCYDACVQVRGEENAAIVFREQESADGSTTRLPVVNPDSCNGCGACESVCVSTQAGSTLNATVRAIIVKPLSAERGAS